MFAAFLLSFAVIFVAEMGDKTQLVAMMFALRYGWRLVLTAIAAATEIYTLSLHDALPISFLLSFAVIFVAEMGDKTMLATITLAADHDWVGVWIGSTLGMVVADGLAIIVGAVAGKHLPERLIQLVAAALFLLFGAYMLLENVFPAASTVIIVASAVAIVLVIAAALRALPERLRPAVMRTEPVRRHFAIGKDGQELIKDVVCE